jgi:hypothetical protein
MKWDMIHYSKWFRSEYLSFIYSFRFEETWGWGSNKLIVLSQISLNWCLFFKNDFEIYKNNWHSPLIDRKKWLSASPAESFQVFRKRTSVVVERTSSWKFLEEPLLFQLKTYFRSNDEWASTSSASSNG